ncbi:hypothetical protein D3C81_1810620 [compost metagenome]
MNGQPELVDVAGKDRYWAAASARSKTEVDDALFFEIAPGALVQTFKVVVARVAGADLQVFPEIVQGIDPLFGGGAAFAFAFFGEGDIEHLGDVRRNDR